MIHSVLLRFSPFRLSESLVSPENRNNGIFGMHTGLDQSQPCEVRWKRLTQHSSSVEWFFDTMIASCKFQFASAHKTDKVSHSCWCLLVNRPPAEDRNKIAIWPFVRLKMHIIMLAHRSQSHSTTRDSSRTISGYATYRTILKRNGKKSDIKNKLNIPSESQSVVEGWLEEAKRTKPK